MMVCSCVCRFENYASHVTVDGTPIVLTPFDTSAVGHACSIDLAKSFNNKALYLARSAKIMIDDDLSLTHKQ